MVGGVQGMASGVPNESTHSGAFRHWDQRNASIARAVATIAAVSARKIVPPNEAAIQPL
jgi:hypothetical protein